MFDEGAAVELLTEYRKDPSPKLWNQLAKVFIPLVKCTITVGPHHPEYDDLLQEGIIKVMAAIPKFDPEKGRVYSFFSTCIRNKLNTALSSLSNVETSTDPDVLDSSWDGQEAVLIPEEPQDPPDLTRIVEECGWRVRDPRMVQACNYFRNYLRTTQHPDYRDGAIRTASAIYGLSRPDAEFCLNLAVVTLRKRLIDATQE